MAINYGNRPALTLEALIEDLRERQFKGEFEPVSVFMSNLINRLSQLDGAWKEQQRAYVKQLREKDAEMQSLRTLNRRLKRGAFSR